MTFWRTGKVNQQAARFIQIGRLNQDVSPSP